MLRTMLKALTATIVITCTALAQVPTITQPRPPSTPQMAVPPVALVARPRVAEVIPADGLRARNPANPDAVSSNDGEIGGLVTLMVENLPPRGSVVVVDPFSDREAGAQLDAMPLDSGVFCSAGLDRRAIPASGSPSNIQDRYDVDANGVARFARRSGFRLLPGHVLARDFAGPCQGRIALDVYAPNAKGAVRHFVKTPAFRLPNQRKRVRFLNTASLQSVFRFVMNSEGASICSGGMPGLPVGMHAIGGDLTLIVRSGPLGTVCRAVSAGVALPESVNITAISWNVAKTAPAGQTSKCCFADECMARVKDFVVLQPGHLPENVPARYQGIGPDVVMRRLLGAPAPELKAGEHQVGFAHAWMACDATALTDHSVSVTLRSVDFEVPHDYDFPQ